jgi:hypothetical protein
MKIVAISGWKGSGKDTVADFLIRTYGFKRLSFADELKDMAASQYGIPRTHFDDRDYKEVPILDMPVYAKDEWTKTIIEMSFKHLKAENSASPSAIIFQNNQALGVFNHLEAQHHLPLYHTPRSLCVIEGSTKRAISHNYWVKRVLNKAIQDNIYVISDLRYLSEIEDLKKELKDPSSLVTLRIVRFESTDSTDASERDLDHYHFDFVINNLESEGKTLREVFQSVSEAMVDSGVVKPLKNFGL